MRRLTTPTHQFKINGINPAEWDEFRITYSQNGKIVLEKTENDDVVITPSDVTPNGYIIKYRLSQSDTEAFKPNIRTEMQIRAHYPDGTVIASKIMALAVEDVLNQEFLGDEDE